MLSNPARFLKVQTLRKWNPEPAGCCSPPASVLRSHDRLPRDEIGAYCLAESGERKETNPGRGQHPPTGIFAYCPIPTASSPSRGNWDAAEERLLAGTSAAASHQIPVHDSPARPWPRSLSRAARHQIRLRETERRLLPRPWPVGTAAPGSTGPRAAACASEACLDGGNPRDSLAKGETIWWHRLVSGAGQCGPSPELSLHKHTFPWGPKRGRLQALGRGLWSTELPRITGEAAFFPSWGQPLGRRGKENEQFPCIQWLLSARQCVPFSMNHIV